MKDINAKIVDFETSKSKKELFDNFTSYQITEVLFDHNNSNISLALIHESGHHSRLLKFLKVRRFTIENPAYLNEPPFLIDYFKCYKLDGDGSAFLKKTGYGHFNRDGTVQSFFKGTGELYSINIGGDVNIDVIFEELFES